MSHDLDRLNAFAFENLVVALARNVIGPGIQSFGAGPDAGRDALFEGRAAYPTAADNWQGRWILQAKFYSGKADGGNQWLLKQIRSELESFSAPHSKRSWPDVWIVATNIDPSGVAETGAYDKAVSLVKRYNAKLAKRFHIWGGKAVIDFLYTHKNVADTYRHFLTPGHVMSAILDAISQDRSSAKDVIRHLIVDLIEENKNTRLQDAGAKEDSKPGIHELFIDLPYITASDKIRRPIAKTLFEAAHQPLSPAVVEPRRGEGDIIADREQRIWFVKAGPGRGKSTVGQYLSQVWRSSFLLETKHPFVLRGKVKELARKIKECASKRGHWPSLVRLPLQIELKEYAQWMSGKPTDEPRGVLTFLSWRLQRATENKVGVGLLRALLAEQNWFIMFDGLDEVPSDLKDGVGKEVMRFVQNVCEDVSCDALFLMTSRPQGYSGQFEGIDGLTVSMADLEFDEAVECATPVLEFDRTKQQTSDALQALRAAKSSPAVVNLMRTPLQSHIMAIVVRDGHQPPERRWKLFSNFYDVIRKREAAKKIDDNLLYRLLTNEDKLLKTIHNRTGFVVHARSEKGEGAQTNISRSSFDEIVRSAADDLVSHGPDKIAAYVSKAATERLVLVNTPDSGTSIRFDVRQLQEFFAGEFIYDSVGLETILRRLKCIIGDAHWREVVYFTVSAFIETSRNEDIWASSKLLREIDEQHERGWDKSVTRAMARGACIVLNLAEEGVFEQDKRIRSMFSTALAGCASGCISGLIETLRFKRGSQTLRWIIEEMASVVRKGQTMEEFGAMLLLLSFMPDSDPNAVQIRDIICKVDDSVLDQLLEIRVARYGRQLQLQHWLVSVCADRLAKRPVSDFSSYWPHYIFEVAYRFDLIDNEPFNGYSDQAAYNAILILRSVGRSKMQGLEAEGRLIDESLPKDVGDGFEAAFKYKDWFVPGSLFDVFSKAYAFSKTREKQHLAELLDLLDGNIFWVSATPILGRYLLTRKLIGRLRKNGAVEMLALPDVVDNATLMARFKGTFIDHYHRPVAEMDDEGWEDYCVDDPFYALYTVIDGRYASRADLGRAKADILMSVVEKEPSALVNMSPYLAQLQRVLGPRTREIVTSQHPFEGDASYDIGRWSLSMSDSIPDIELPREMVLIPAIAARTVELMARHPAPQSLQELQNALRNRISRWNSLKGLVLDNDACSTTRCGAFVLAVVAEGDEITDSWIGDNVVHLYSPSVPAFCIRFICLWSRRIPAERIDVVARMLSRLLSNPSLLPRHRCELEQVVEYLRETSFAPITAAAVESAWLRECSQLAM